MYSHSSPCPVYIVGSPRSGNTLLGAILNKHPDFLILFESNTFSNIYRWWRARCELDPSKSPALIFSELIQERWAHTHQRVGLVAEEIEATAKAAGPDWNRLLDAHVTLIMSRAKPSATRWGDKTPHHVANLSQIKSHFPAAQVIYTYRDPRAVVASLTKPSFPHSPDNPYLNAEVVRDYFRSYNREKQQIRGEDVLEVRYEDLVQKPAESVQAICSFLGVEFTPALLEPANDEIRRAVGWPDDKAWDKIVPQPSRMEPSTRSEVNWYLRDIILAQQYDPGKAEQSLLSRILILSKIAPFRLTAMLIKQFWRRKYPGAPFLLQQYPEPTHYLRWLAELLGGPSNRRPPGQLQQQ